MSPARCGCASRTTPRSRAGRPASSSSSAWAGGCRPASTAGNSSSPAPLVASGQMPDVVTAAERAGAVGYNVLRAPDLWVLPHLADDPLGPVTAKLCETAIVFAGGAFCQKCWAPGLESSRFFAPGLVKCEEWHGARPTTEQSGQNARLRGHWAKRLCLSRPQGQSAGPWLA